MLQEVTPSIFRDCSDRNTSMYGSRDCYTRIPSREVGSQRSEVVAEPRAAG